MDKPPHTGGSPPVVACNIIIERFSKLDESSVDTDVDQRNDRKRMRLDSFQNKVDCVDTTTVNTQQHPSPPSDVSQSIKNPIGRTFYETYDIGPFVVHAQKVSSDTDISSLHPVQFGYFLKKNSFKNIINGSIKRVGRNRISLSFSDHKCANEFINNPCLARNNYKAFIPSFNVTRIGLVRGVPAEWSPEEILDNISLPVGSGGIIKIRRLNYKVRNSSPPEWKPSQTIVITFDGQTLPKHVFVCYNALPVELYAYPTIQCYSCCRFGHTKSNCNSRPRCLTSVAKAILGTHATYKMMPRLAVYVLKFVSYAEANKVHDQVSKSFAEIVKFSNIQNTPNSPVPHVSPSSPSIPSDSRSYKKTIFAKPTSPKLKQLGYNKTEHFNLIKDYDAPAPSNGVALINSNVNNRDIISDLIQLLTEIKSNSNNNVTEQRRQTIAALTKLKSAYTSRTRTNNPVELQMRYLQ
ncbi:unnamed protein product [Pieris macdunnoughi]|uniref:CCHC-type domain-containing protein n=1 Tax=Pieris macdunnoughi TaxID=345717 RepID=A0A821VTD2_9NEOP|nr:unnamed protein product [Pieris macdunnoughi]